MVPSGSAFRQSSGGRCGDKSLPESSWDSGYASIVACLSSFSNVQDPIRHPGRHHSQWPACVQQSSQSKSGRTRTAFDPVPLQRQAQAGRAFFSAVAKSSGPRREPIRTLGACGRSVNSRERRSKAGRVGGPRGVVCFGEAVPSPPEGRQQPPKVLNEPF